VRANLAATAPDIVYVGLGFPKQERLIARLAPFFPATWFISCGAAIPFAANVLPRAPKWMQSTGLEWAFRLLSEPRRLYRRYLLHDLPFAVRLLAVSTGVRLGKAGEGARVEQTNLECHPLRAEFQPGKMDSSFIADSSAGHQLPRATPNHVAAEPFPAPSPLPRGLMPASQEGAPPDGHG